MRAHDDQLWLETGRIVADRVKEGKQVLVTCMQGQNRSWFVCAVALHHLKCFSGARSVQYVQKHRPGSLWNKAFVTWLVTNLQRVRDMNLDTYRIFQNLYQGSIPPGGDIIANAGFDVLVLCAWENQNVNAYSGIEVIQAPGEDLFDTISDQQDLENWKNAAELVTNRLKEGKRVLVTCIGGYNRSGLVVALVMHNLTSWAIDDIIDHIKMKRPGALHNKAFVSWLKDTL